MTTPANLEPALVSPGKRILARVIICAANVAVSAAWWGYLITLIQTGFRSSAPESVTLVFSLVIGGYAVLNLILVFVKAQTLGSLFLGFDYRDATGKPSGGKLFLQTLVTDLIGLGTCGVGFIVQAVTCRPGQSFVDRWFGLYAVHPKLIGTEAPAAAEPPAPGRVHQVTMPGMAGSPPASPRPAPQPGPVAPQARPVPAPASPQPAPAAGVPASWLAPQAMPAAPSTPQPGEVIRSVPFVPRSLAPTPTSPPSQPTPPPVAATHDETVLDDAEPEAVLLRLDDGTPLLVDRPLVFGRNPVAPAEYPGARPVELVDESMKLSKNHAVAHLVAGTLHVVDLGSRNGVQLVVDGVKSKLVPGQTTPVPAGAHVRMGGRSFTVEAS